MPRHINDHTPVGASVSLSSDHLASLAGIIEDLFTPLRDVAQEMLAKKSEASAPAVLSAEQFDELKALLQPGYELSTLMLEDYKRQREFALADHAAEKGAPEGSAVSESPLS